jgi:hypothetical protein
MIVGGSTAGLNLVHNTFDGCTSFASEFGT